MHQLKAGVRLSPYSASNPNTRISTTENNRGHKVKDCWNRLEGGFYDFCIQLHAYASSGAGNTSYQKNYSTERVADYHVTVGWNAVF